ncbi:MAG: xylulokinase [Rhodothermales bacterium]|nr:xylulokinase [Rhodothermales bacterium]
MLLGIDVSTTATKALLIDEAGAVVATAAHPHDLSTPRPLWSEQDPAQWWAAAQRSIRRVLEAAGTDAVDAVGLTGQMHGLVLLDAAGQILRPAILWNDQRAGAACDAIRAALGLDRLVALTGNDAFAGFTAPKLLWARRHEPEIYARVAHVLLPKDYVRYCLTGGFATDRAGAGGTLLLDLTTRDWSADVLRALDVPAAWLPPTHEGTEVTGTVSAEAARATGLPAGTPVVGGGGDQAAQAVGVGAVAPEVWALTVGTSGVVFAPSEAPRTAPEGRAHAFPHAVPGRWHLMGVMLSAAGSLQWYRDALAPGVGFEALVDEAAAVAPGCEGLTFLPYLSGERTPHADPHARGAFAGLTLRHARGHLTRAVLEGVAFGLRDNLRLLGEAGLPPPSTIRLSGGGARAALWRQILADVLAVPLATVETTEGAAFGAALLAGVGAGVWPSVDAACDAAVRVAETTRPREPAAYEAPYERFRALYPALRAVG